MDYINDKYPALLQLLEKRVELAEKYLELTQQQKTSIAADDENALLDSISKRGELIKEIEDANKGAQDALREYKSSKHSGAPEADYLIKRTNELYENCLELDRQNMDAIKSLMEKATEENKELQKRREGINKYAQADYIFTPSILDERQ